MTLNNHFSSEEVLNVSAWSCKGDGFCLPPLREKQLTEDSRALWASWGISLFHSSPPRSPFLLLFFLIPSHGPCLERPGIGFCFSSEFLWALSPNALRHVQRCYPEDGKVDEISHRTLTWILLSQVLTGVPNSGN